MKEQYQIIRYYRGGMKNLVYDGFASAFKTEQEAQEAMRADMEKEKTGMPVVRDFDIVRYEIRKREVTPWEIIDKIKVDPK